jgi:hypothetical protein
MGVIVKVGSGVGKSVGIGGKMSVGVTLGVKVGAGVESGSSSVSLESIVTPTNPLSSSVVASGVVDVNAPLVPSRVSSGVGGTVVPTPSLHPDKADAAINAANKAAVSFAENLIFLLSPQPT